MQGSDQQGYDRGSTIFSPDGRLYQVEYAREAVERGSPAVGVRTEGGVVLAARGRVRSPLQVPESIEKIHRVDGHVGVASAGHAADARRLVDVARRRAQGERLRYGEAVGVETLTKELADHVQEFTQRGGTRPFGTALLVGGVEEGTPRLFETDPSGTPYEWRATAVGSDARDVRGHLEEHYRADADLDGGVDLAVEALAVSADGGLAPGSTGIATVDAATGEFRALEPPAVRERLAENGLLDEGAAS